ncbi:MAG: flagellar export protein FliJ [Deltaproteobacteria bacterium]|nr:flagellar export protein FliJ [Deltaproteobacteria bacterium]
MFRFNLQQVLDFRRQREEKMELELAEARRVMEREQERLAFFRDRQAHYQRELAERQKQGMETAETALYSAYIRFLREKIEWQMEAVETARKQVETKKEEVLAARMDRKVLDRLRSRRHRAFLEDTRREETRRLDEVALGRFEARLRDRRG